MRVIARLLVGLSSLAIAYFVTMFLEGFTGAPLGNGGMEGTPATIFVAFIIFPFTLIATLVLGNIWLNRWFRGRDQSDNS